MWRDGGLRPNGALEHSPGLPMPMVTHRQQLSAFIHLGVARLHDDRSTVCAYTQGYARLNIEKIEEHVIKYPRA